MMPTPPNKPSPDDTFACNMSAIAPADRQQHVATIKAVFGAVEEVRELDDGFAFRLMNEEAILMQVAAFIATERLCCPFFGFRIEMGPEGGPLWLNLTGREGVKPFIKMEIGEDLPDEIARTW